MNKELLMNTQTLREFLTRANRAGYASGERKNWTTEEDGSTTIVFESGEFRMHDNFFGGEPFGGREVIFYQGKPIWMMAYYGKVTEGGDTKRIYATLRKALSNPPSEMPVRGPLGLEDGELTYENSWKGDIGNFSGRESIVNDRDQTVYNATYAGGWVDKKSS